MASVSSIRSAIRTARAEISDLLPLPAPRMVGGMPLMDALRTRRSMREYGTKPLPAETLSNLLWAAFGVNRPESGGRTAPSARNWREIDVYAATADGLFLYDAGVHALKRIASSDIRARTGLQDFVAVAPLDLVYVADLTRMTDASDDQKEQFEGPDAGFIAQNVYLFCASEGLATVVRGMVDRPSLGRLMQLGPEQHIILAQTVGYAKECEPRILCS
jgi:SagB-type dehydrogenase family enzyme